MKQFITYLRSMVARRILALFILCAMLPIVTLGILSLYQVSGTLQEATYERLRISNKNVSMTVLAGLNLFKDELEAAASPKEREAAHPFSLPALRHRFSLPLHFRTLSLIEDRSRVIAVSGKPCPLPPLSDATIEKLVSGSALVYVEPFSDVAGRVFMTVVLPGERSAVHLLIGEIDTEYLWESVRQALPALTEVAIIDAGGNLLYSSLRPPPSVVARVRESLRKSATGQLEWRDAGENWLANYRSIFLRGAFLSGDWTVLLSQSRGEALAARSQFTGTFTLVLALTLLVVLYLSSVYIRRSLIPLKRLREGTSNVSRGDLVSRVEINSGDEFEELAHSFNTMSDHLQKQFDSLTEMGRIIRTILSALDREKIIAAVLDNLQSVITCDQVALFVLEPGSQGTVSAYRGGTGSTVPLSVTLSPAERLRLETIPENILLERNGDFADLLSDMEGDGPTVFALLPIRLHRGLGGALVLGYRNRPENPQEDLLRARQIADQVAVAFVNADLINELAQLNWGTLTALARAVDTNSHWTAGHSERVTEISLQIGQQMGLPPRELELLHRGGLLHDIGKIGISGAILDKPDKLTDEEFTLIKEHPAKGGAILEPIPFYREIIPLVAQHHKRYNGEGYPLGLAGYEIILGARILAVADVYDALLSDRPYRSSWEIDRVIAYIKERSGQFFDPAVVQAFLDSIGRAPTLAANIHKLQSEFSTLQPVGYSIGRQS